MCYLQNKFKIICIALFLIGLACSAPGDGDPLANPHPDYNLISLRPDGFNVRVIGLGFFSDGRLAIATWNNFEFNSEVYIVEGGAIQSGNPADVDDLDIIKYAEGLREIGGLHVINDSLYITQKHQITLLIDANGNEQFDDNTQERIPLSDCDEKWGVWNATVADPHCPDAYRVSSPPGKNLEFATSSVYNPKTDKFFVGLPTVWEPNREMAPERSCVVEVDRRTGAWEVWACGMRTPNALAFGPEGTLWMGDNQGHFNPASPFSHIRKGKHYGMIKTAYNANHTYPSGFSEDEVTPPSLWLAPDRILSISPSDPVYLKKGIFKGQFIIGDDNLGTLQRIFMERIDGVYQGAHFHFCGGLEAGTQKLIMDDKGALIIGGLGVGGDVWGGWNWAGTQFGLMKLTPKDDLSTPEFDPGGNVAHPKFEMLAIRSTGPNGFEIEFTAPVGNNADNAGSYSVSRFHYEPNSGYGGNPVGNAGVDVSSAAIVSDTRIQLTLSNFNPDLSRTGKSHPEMVRFRLGDITSADGDQLWAKEAYYTLLTYGPADVNGCMDPTFSEYNPNAVYDDGVQCVSGCTDVKYEEYNPAAQVHDASMCRTLDVQRIFTASAAVLHGDRYGITVSVKAQGAHALTIADVAGRRLAARSGRGPEEYHFTQLPKGIYFLNVIADGRNVNRRISCF